MRDRVRFASFLLGGIRYEETIKIFALGIWSRLGLSDYCLCPLSQGKQHGLFRPAGAALYFLLVPNAFDTTFAYVRTLLGNEGLSQLESNGLSVQTYAIITWQRL